MMDLQQFDFIRPLWLLGLLPLAGLLWMFFRLRASSRSWEAVCDAALLDHVLEDRQQVS